MSEMEFFIDAESNFLNAGACLFEEEIDFTSPSPPILEEMPQSSMQTQHREVTILDTPPPPPPKARRVRKPKRKTVQKGTFEFVMEKPGTKVQRTNQVVRPSSSSLSPSSQGYVTMEEFASFRDLMFQLVNVNFASIKQMSDGVAGCQNGIACLSNQSTQIADVLNKTINETNCVSSFLNEQIKYLSNAVTAVASKETTTTTTTTTTLMAENDESVTVSEKKVTTVQEKRRLIFEEMKKCNIGIECLACNVKRTKQTKKDGINFSRHYSKCSSCQCEGDCSKCGDCWDATLEKHRVLDTSGKVNGHIKDLVFANEKSMKFAFVCTQCKDKLM